MVCADDWLGQMHESGWLTPLDSYVAEHGEEYVSMCNMVWNSQQEVYNHIYTIPSGLNIKGIFYRTDWVDEIGYEIPTGNDWTYDEYFNLIKALTDAEQKHYGNSFRGARGGIDPCVVYMSTFFGGNYWTEDGKSIFNTEEGIEASLCERGLCGRSVHAPLQAGCSAAFAARTQYAGGSHPEPADKLCN